MLASNINSSLLSYILGVCTYVCACVCDGVCVCVCARTFFTCMSTYLLNLHIKLLLLHYSKLSYSARSPYMD